MDKINEQILQYSYWEHYKRARDLGRVLPIEHAKRKAIEKSLNKISQKLNK